MKWLVLVIALVSGCRAVGDTLHCLTLNDEWKQEACEAASRRERAHERGLRDQADRRRARERDEEVQARHEYRAALGPCQSGDARACFVTALYEERHGAPSTQIAQRYRFACVGGIGRACFLAGVHAPSQPLALASFTHGCELGDGESCRAGLELDPRRTDLVEDACAAGYRWACTTLGR